MATPSAPTSCSQPPSTLILSSHLADLSYAIKLNERCQITGTFKAYPGLVNHTMFGGTSEFGGLLLDIRLSPHKDADEVFLQLLTNVRMETDLREEEICSVFFEGIYPTSYPGNPWTLVCRTARSLALLETPYAKRIPLDVLRMIRQEWRADDGKLLLIEAVNYRSVILENSQDIKGEAVIARIDELIALREKPEMEISDSSDSDSSNTSTSPMTSHRSS